VRKRIVTPSARLRANHVLLAGNVQIGGLMPRIAATLLPVTHTSSPRRRSGLRGSAKVVRYRGAVSDTDLSDNHYRIVGG